MTHRPTEHPFPGGGADCASPPRRRRRDHLSPVRRSGALASVGAIVVAAMLAACSTPGGSAPAGADATANNASVNTVAAQQAIAPLVGKPSAFPVDKPLGKKLPSGATIAFLQCGTTVCGLFAQLLTPAVKAIGAEFTAINSGTTAASSQAAVSSVLALKPAAVLVAGSDPAQFGGGLKQLSDAGIKVVSISVSKDTAPFGITANYIGAATAKSGGSLMADWVIAKKGSSNAVFYGVPAIDYSDTMQAAFKDEMTKNCPSCQVRTVPIDITTLGTTSPQTIVTDLQSHPDSTVAVFASSEMARGLPAALDAAGVKVTTIGYAPTPVNLQDIKDGKLTAGLAVDFPLSAWTAVDVAARLILGEPLTTGEQAGEVPRQLLEQKDITFDPSRGWTGYPDFPQRFAKLWGN
jgi:ribose transport system substrate-binding protein